MRRSEINQAHRRSRGLFRLASLSAASLGLAHSEGLGEALSPRVRDPRQYARLGPDRLRLGQLRSRGSSPLHPAKRKFEAIRRCRPGQGLCGKDHDRRGGPGDAAPFPLVQDGGYHRTRRREPDRPTLGFDARRGYVRGRAASAGRRGTRGKSRRAERYASRPGESVCLEPRVYHRFYAERGSGAALVGESARSTTTPPTIASSSPPAASPISRRTEAPYRLLVSDYSGLPVTPR